jgi:DNA-binding transcriptional MerR regulator
MACTHGAPRNSRIFYLTVSHPAEYNTVMSRDSETLWTIDDLGARVAEALAVGYAGPPNGRVRDVPDRRTIRYYTTLGLIDRPAAMRGRTALYGRRHLMQLAAIKRLQAKGQSLAEIQRTLVGLPDAALGRLADLPPGVGDALPPTRAAPAGGRASGAFWKEENPPKETGPAEKEAEPTLQGVRIAGDATLLLESLRPVDDEDRESIRRAAAPLLRVLRSRGLIGPRQEGGTS